MDTPREGHGGLNTALAAVIQGERAMADLTYDQLADRAGINRQTLLRRLTGEERNRITVDEVAALATVFRLTPAELVAKAEEQQRRMAGDPSPAGLDERELAARMAQKARDSASSGKPPDTGDDGRSVRKQK